MSLFSFTSAFQETQKNNPQSGQIGVVILLLMAVILTVGLSIVTRTTRNVFLSNQTSESAQVFNAAESVLDQAVFQLQESFKAGGGLTPTGTIEVNDTSVTYQITPSNIFATRVFEGSSVMINVVDPVVNPTGLPAAAGTRRLRLDWSSTNFDTDCATTPLQPASLLITIYSVSGTDTFVRTKAIAGCDRSDGFDTPSTTATVPPYRFWYHLTLQTGDLFVRIKPLYNDTNLRVVGTGLTLPNEIFAISADAKNTQGNETRKIQVNQSLPTAPSVMDYVLFSGGSLSK